MSSLSLQVLGEFGDCSPTFEEKKIAAALCDLAARRVDGKLMTNDVSRGGEGHFGAHDFRTHADLETRSWIISAMMKSCARLGSIPDEVQEVLDRYEDSKSVIVHQVNFLALSHSLCFYPFSFLTFIFFFSLIHHETENLRVPSTVFGSHLARRIGRRCCLRSSRRQFALPQLHGRPCASRWCATIRPSWCAIARRCWKPKGFVSPVLFSSLCLCSFVLPLCVFVSLELFATTESRRLNYQAYDAPRTGVSIHTSGFGSSAAGASSSSSMSGPSSSSNIMAGMNIVSNPSASAGGATGGSSTSTSSGGGGDSFAQIAKMMGVSGGGGGGEGEGFVCDSRCTRSSFLNHVLSRSASA